MCGRQGQAAASSTSTSEGCHRHALPDIQGLAEKHASFKGTIQSATYSHFSFVRVIKSL